MDNLFPCPFCGGEAEIVKGWACLVETYAPVCKDKSCMGRARKPQRNLYEAVKAWNKREIKENVCREIPHKLFQGRCFFCDLDLLECDWGNEDYTLQEDLENQFKYCPRCGQRLDWNGDLFYDKMKKENVK